ncbi:hypothetical protein PSCLAVI8L_150010 [Pseudoclavibacter sp. 8L]|nr:hypothetical protein PSCLAVI8L_150010 [Pseudoclavibacter sp. 8L]
MNYNDVMIPTRGQVPASNVGRT